MLLAVGLKSDCDAKSQVSHSYTSLRRRTDAHTHPRLVPLRSPREAASCWVLNGLTRVRTASYSSATLRQRHLVLAIDSCCRQDPIVDTASRPRAAPFMYGSAPNPDTMMVPAAEPLAPPPPPHLLCCSIHTPVDRTGVT